MSLFDFLQFATMTEQLEQQEKEKRLKEQRVYGWLSDDEDEEKEEY